MHFEIQNWNLFEVFLENLLQSQLAVLVPTRRAFRSIPVSPSVYSSFWGEGESIRKDSCMTVLTGSRGHIAFP